MGGKWILNSFYADACVSIVSLLVALYYSKRVDSYSINIQKSKK